MTEITKADLEAVLAAGTVSTISAAHRTVTAWSNEECRWVPIADLDDIIRLAIKGLDADAVSPPAVQGEVEAVLDTRTMPHDGGPIPRQPAVDVVAEVREALKTIAASSIPDQPMSGAGDELSWAQRHVAHLRSIAGKAHQKLARQSQPSGADSHGEEARLRAALELAVTQLDKAADQFAFYADQHAAKGTKEAEGKAMTNHQWALACGKAAHGARQALTQASDNDRKDGE